MQPLTALLQSVRFGALRQCRRNAPGTFFGKIARHRNFAKLQASYAAKSAQTRSYSIWTNGEKVPNPLSTATPSGYNLITYRYDENVYLPCVGYLASDRNIDGRVGGKRLCEVIGFTRVLSDSERVAVESYLRAKWFEETWYRP